MITHGQLSQKKNIGFLSNPDLFRSTFLSTNNSKQVMAYRTNYESVDLDFFLSGGSTYHSKISGGGCH